MDSTNLTLAGFTQPAVARNLIESPSNYEKGLPQRFLWMFPKTTYAYLEMLKPIDVVFTSALGTYAWHFLLLLTYCKILQSSFSVKITGKNQKR